MDLKSAPGKGNSSWVRRGAKKGVRDFFISCDHFFLGFSRVGVLWFIIVFISFFVLNFLCVFPYCAACDSAAPVVGIVLVIHFPLGFPLGSGCLLQVSMPVLLSVVHMDPLVVLGSEVWTLIISFSWVIIQVPSSRWGEGPLVNAFLISLGI